MRTQLIHLGRRTRDAWLILGLSAALALAVELGARLVLASTAPALDPRAHAAAHENAPWAAGVFAELRASERMRWQPFVHWRREPFAGKWIQIDERGLRRTVPRGAPGARKVWFFGGSTAWGTGARDEGTIPSRLAAATGWDVRNYGEMGYVSNQELVLLALELERGERPDLVIFYDGVNDVFSAFQTRAAGLPQNEPNRIREFNLTKNPSRLCREALLAAVRESATISLVRRVLPEPPSPRPLAREERERLAGEIARAYTRGMDEAAALGRANGFAVACFLQPVVFTKRSKHPEESAFAAERAYVGDLYRDAYERIRLAPPAGFHDASDAFGDEAAPRFIDFCHLAESGNSVVAARMVEALRGQ